MASAAAPKTGWLYKSNAKCTHWRYRWAVLEEPSATLLVFRDETAQHSGVGPKHRIELRGARLIKDDHSTSLAALAVLPLGGARRFGIACAERVYHFCTENATAHEDWAVAIARAILHAPRIVTDNASSSTTTDSSPRGDAAPPVLVRAADASVEPAQTAARRMTDLAYIAQVMRLGLDVRDRTYHLRKYRCCFLGCDAVQWLCAQVGELRRNGV